MHLTAGYVHRDRPEFSASFVVSGTRFKVEPDRVMEPFVRRRAFPRRWMDRITLAPSWTSTSGSYGTGGTGTAY